MRVDVINITQNSITLFTHSVPTALLPAPDGSPGIHTCDRTYRFDGSCSWIKYTMFMYCIWMLNRWALFLYIFDWRMMCDVRARRQRSIAVAVRTLWGRTSECTKVTYIRFGDFFYYISKWSICRATVCVILHMCHRRKLSVRLGRSQCDSCFTTFIIGKILCVLQSTRHTWHVHSTFGRPSSNNKYRIFF